MTRVLARRYELRRLLATGGTAHVWEAVDRRLDRPVAVKLLAGHPLDDRIRPGSAREARLAVRFGHPHAVTVYDTGEEEGIPYLVMELVEGPTLAQVLAERGPLDSGEAVAIADQVLAAVAAGHRAGLVHRDIKPSNILFTGGMAKLADFGTAEAIGELATQLTAADRVVGTPRYLSPEQAAGAAATPASDIYAMGVVLFEMLSGAPPFVGDTPIATAAAHLGAPVPSLVQRRAGLDRGLAAVVERALAKSPDARYPGAAAMREALASPPTTGPPGADVAGTAGFGTRRLTVPPGPAPGTRRPRHGRTPGRRRRVAVVLSFALLTAGATSAVANMTGGGGKGDGDRELASPRLPGAPTTVTTTTTTEPAPATEADATTTTTAPTTTTGEPAATATTAPDSRPPTVATLTALLADHSGVHGERGDDLLDKVEKLERLTGEKQVKEARKQIEHVTRWAEKGELEADTARLVTTVLVLLADPVAADS